MYRSVDELPDRIASRIRSLLVGEESFVVGARATDGMLDRWSTYVVVTDERLLTVRVVLLETDITGVRLGRLNEVRFDESAASLGVEYGLEQMEFAFGSTEDARRLADAMGDARSATGSA